MTNHNRALWDLVEKWRKGARNLSDWDDGRNDGLGSCADDLSYLLETSSPHSDDIAVDMFASAMKAKLAESRSKGRSGWTDKADCSQKILSDMLRSHVDKGDPRDVANFCMFLHMRGEAILERPVVVGDRVIELENTVAQLISVVDDILFLSDVDPDYNDQYENVIRNARIVLLSKKETES